MTELYVACIDQNKTVLQDNLALCILMTITITNFQSQELTLKGIIGHATSQMEASLSIVLFTLAVVGQNINIPNPQLAASDATGYVVMELVIPMGDDEY